MLQFGGIYGKIIQSVLAGGEDVEVIIVDDGSTKDETAKIADEYAAKYPTIVKAVHQENGGHGQAVNTGLAHATGKYFKVVDSDDWVDLKSYRRVLATLKKFDEAKNRIWSLQITSMKKWVQSVRKSSIMTMYFRKKLFLHGMISDILSWTSTF